MMGIFDKVQWPIKKTCQVIWEALQDYGMETKNNFFERGPICGSPRHFQGVQKMGGQKPYCDSE